MLRKIENPSFKKRAFTCPNCSTFSNHDWKGQEVNETTGDFYGKRTPSCADEVYTIWICQCQHCKYISFWYRNMLIWPLASSVEMPIDEMPDDIKKLYEEARSIVQLSPKGACAILRLALQKMCNRLANQDEKEKINKAIKKLVENGLPVTVQQAMDTIRIIGDEAVHPGEISIDDNIEIAYAMFRLMNIIVEKMIVEPQEINELFEMMPSEKKDGIKNRDNKEK